MKDKRHKTNNELLVINKEPKLGLYFIINGIEQIKIATAGVGTPIKESVWRVSLLNLAKRMHEKMVMRNPK